jgi:molecular chaperone DnaK
VSAKDKDTGAEQKITVTESGTLDKGEVERMVREAEQHRAEDQQIRQRVDASNELDSAAYQLERGLQERGEVPEHERARATMLIEEARQAVREEAPTPRLRQLTEDVRQMTLALSSGGGDRGQAAQPQDADDVIDADFNTG